jgi:omega-amidase
MRIYCCQTNIEWENKEANFAHVQALLGSQPIERESLVLLPEMFATGFSMNIPGIAEDQRSPTEQFLAETARQKGVFLMGGIVAEGKHGCGRNEAVLFSPQGQLVVRYCKLQPFTLGGESDNYNPGERVVVASWRGFSLSPFVCYDLRFPELFRAAVRRGANLFTVIANWPVARIQHWVTLLQARAIENQAYVAGVNRCGQDPKLKYNGRSLIVNPRGEIIADARDGEGLISADLDLEQLSAYRKELPFLKDMRPDYAAL